jgi:hypothetical protein
MAGEILESEQQALLVELAGAWSKQRSPFKGTVLLPEWEEVPFRHPGLPSRSTRIKKHDLDTLESAGYVRTSKPYGQGGLPHDFIEIHFVLTNAGMEHLQSSKPSSNRWIATKRQLRSWRSWLWHATNHQVVGALVVIVRKPDSSGKLKSSPLFSKVFELSTLDH